MRPLFVESIGMVTSAGLTAPQSTASFLAAVDGFSETFAADVVTETQTVASVPANWRLRQSPAAWLANMAARAGSEALGQSSAVPSRTLLLCAVPEQTRDHPCWLGARPEDFLTALQTRLGGPYARGSQLVMDGPASLLGVLPQAAAALDAGRVNRILLIGADSLLNPADMARLRASGRLLGLSAQGLVPAEGAVALVLSIEPCGGSVLRAVGMGQEADTVAGPRQSQGNGMLNALRSVCAQDGCSEAEVDFIVSNFNGERYGALEMLVYRARFYRTFRERLPTVYPAMSFGETGAASAAMTLAVAADAFAKRLAPGRHAMLEVAGDNGMRAAAILSGTPAAG